jgi:hypothetical protein
MTTSSSFSERCFRHDNLRFVVQSAADESGRLAWRYAFPKCEEMASLRTILSMMEGWVAFRPVVASDTARPSAAPRDVRCQRRPEKMLGCRSVFERKPVPDLVRDGHRFA